MARRLQERDGQILDLARRYRIVTPEVLQCRFFPDQSEEAMKSTLKRLRRKDAPLLGSEKLYTRGNQVYYHLTAAGAAQVGASASFAEPVRDHELLVRLLGQLLFCCAGENVRPRFTLEEFSSAFPEVASEKMKQRLPYNGYYLDVDEGGARRLGRMVVENGGSDVVARAREFVRQDEDALPRFVEEGRYTVALIVPSQSKAVQLQRQLAERPLGEVRAVRILVEAYPQLEGLLTGVGK